MASNNGNSINHFSGTINTPIIVDDCFDHSLKYAGLPYGIEWLRSTPVALLLEPEVLPQVAGNCSKPLAHTVSEPDSVVRTAEQLKKVKFVPNAATLAANVEKVKEFSLPMENGGPWFHFCGLYFQYRATHGVDCLFLDEILQSSKTIEALHMIRRWIKGLTPDFQHCYQEKVNTLKLQNVLWAEEHFTAIKDGQYAALYSFVYLGSPWGAVKVNFHERYICIGDGVNCSDNAYKTAKCVMRALIERCYSQSEYKYWDVNMRFPKMDQPIGDSSSCGVIAAYMIEKNILGQDPAAKWDEKLNFEYRGQYFVRAIYYKCDHTLVLSNSIDRIPSELAQKAILKVDETDDLLGENDFLRCGEAEVDERVAQEEGHKDDTDNENKNKKLSQSLHMKSYHHFQADFAKEYPHLDSGVTPFHNKTKKEISDSITEPDDYLQCQQHEIVK
ncbi:hypothetical protein FBU30_000422, partial [Linnemannia zychae]